MELSLLKNDDQAKGSHRGKHTPLADKVNTERSGRTSPFLHSPQLLHISYAWQFRFAWKCISIRWLWKGVYAKVKCSAIKRVKGVAAFSTLKRKPHRCTWLVFLSQCQRDRSVFAVDGIHGVGRETQGTMGWLKAFPGIWKLKAKLFQPRQILPVVLPRFLKNPRIFPSEFWYHH